MPTKKSKVADVDISYALPELPPDLRKRLDQMLGYEVCPKCDTPTFTFVRGPLKGFTRFGCWHAMASVTVLLIKSVLRKVPDKKKPKRKRA